MKILKRLALLLSLLTVLTCALAAFSLSAGASGTSPSLSIEKHNLTLGDSIFIKYAVRAEGIDPSQIKLLVWQKPQTSYEYAGEVSTDEYTVISHKAKATVGGVTYYVFSYNELVAKQMGTPVYAVAYADIGGTAYYSAVDKYSVLEYAYTQMGKLDAPENSPEVTKLLQSTLDYGAMAQTILGSTDPLVNLPHARVQTVGGVIRSDGFTKGLYPVGGTVTLTAPSKNASGKSFSYWKDSAGLLVSTSAEFDLTVGEHNDIYTAVYGSSYSSPVDTYSEGLTFTSNGDGTCYVSAASSDVAYAITIPSLSPAGDRVTAIGSRVFSGNTSLIAVIIPDTVTSIGTRAFSGCSALSAVTLSDSVTSIGESAFYGCSALTSVNYSGTDAKWSSITIASGNTALTHARGSSSSGLEFTVTINFDSTKRTCSVSGIGSCRDKVIVIPSTTVIGGVTYTVTAIAPYAFDAQAAITSITIPSTVESIGEGAFRDCSALTNVNIPSSVAAIRSFAFEGCTSLRSFSVATGNPYYYTSGGHLFRTNGSKTAIVRYAIGQTAESYAIPSGIRYIDPYAFSGAVYLKSVTIPSTVKEIHEGAFYGCTSLEGITIPDSVNKNILPRAFHGCTNLTSVIIGSGVTGIDQSAFYGCTALNTVSIGASVASIDRAAFYGCSSLKSVTVPSAVTLIGDHAFDGCTSLTGVSLSGSLATIGDYAFANCSSLTGITIPYKVSTIGAGALSGCVKLSTISVASGNTRYKSIDGSLYSYDGATLIQYAVGRTATTFTVPSTVVTIGARAFFGSTRLTAVTIPSSVTTIGAKAFYGCTALTGADLTGGVEDVGDSAYSGCTKLSSVTLSEDLRFIGKNAFTGCSALSSIVLPSGVNTIERSTFYGCKSLTDVTLHVSVTSIGASAFENCTALTTVTFKDTESKWTSVFKGKDWDCGTADYTVYFEPIPSDDEESGGVTNGGGNTDGGWGPVVPLS